MPARRKNELDPQPSDLSFEAAMAELESIVEAMEGEELPLEDLIAGYETGAKLLKHCGAVLGSARKRIELITLAAGETADPTVGGISSPISRKTPESAPVDPDDDNDISLF